MQSPRSMSLEDLKQHLVSSHGKATSLPDDHQLVLGVHALMHQHNHSDHEHEG